MEIQLIRKGVKSGALGDLVQEIKQYKINVPFFIAGGSVFSTMNKTDYNDIDVYFYNQEDYETASKILLDIFKKREKEDREHEKSSVFSQIDISSLSKHQTKNSLSINGLTKQPLQLICKNFGEPDYILKGFDLYNSMCCITSEGDVWVHPECTKELKVNFDIINFQTLQRSFKYIENKKCIDSTEQIKKLITFIVENAFETMLDGYSEQKFQAIVSICRQQFKGKFEKFFYQVHDNIRNIYNDEDKLKLFSRLITNKTLRRVPLHHYMCPEYYLAYYMYLRKRKKVLTVDDTSVFPSEVWGSLGDKYPEYLI